MNPEQYQEYKNKYPNFDQKHVIDVLLKNIEISHIEDQVRTAGEDKDHLYELTCYLAVKRKYKTAI